MNEYITLVKITVCAACCSPEIIYRDCICTYSNRYDTIELEFEQCNCCGRTSSQPADTPFNNEQYKNFEKKRL